ncbi:hypothetical protein TNCV_1576841 [Trichonephila clavipes]|nr:hypothetical protein TNCV_1576841 [Trichonephila clavipes]
MVAQRLTQITPPAATLDQLWQRVEAAWSAVPQEHIQSLFESMPIAEVPSSGEDLILASHCSYGEETGRQNNLQQLVSPIWCRTKNIPVPEE